MNRLTEIETRMKAIAAELDQEGADIGKLETEIATLTEERKTLMANVEKRKKLLGDIAAGTTGTVIETAPDTRKAEIDKYDSVEYRNAFMRYCRTGEEIPMEYRDNAYTGTGDAAAVIPTTIMNEIIKEMKQYGQLYSRVRKSNVQGGVRVPILSLKPTASRITEAAASERKKVTASTYVSFSYLGLECKVAVSMLAGAVTLPLFEQQIVPLITEAMIKQLEIEIVSGNGTTEMLGVTVDDRVAAGQSITLASTEFDTWEAWKKKVFAKIPLSYRAGGVFIMAAGTWDGYIDGMVDANGQPIGRVNYGIADAAQQRFGGKEVLLVEDDIIAPYDTASTGDVVAIYMRPQDYCINSNMQMSMFRWFDHDTNQWVDKAVLINDGKLLDAAGVLLIKKGA